MENIFGNIKTFKDVEVFAGDDVNVAANANIRNLTYENLEESQDFRTYLQLKGNIIQASLKAKYRGWGVLGLGIKGK